jgi:5'-nucleotidase (lipoprotein e(P4) family)
MFANNFCAAETVQEINKRLNAESEEYYAIEKLYNENIMSSAWINTAAEYRALCYQAYNAVKMQVDNAVKDRKRNDKPLAIILDVDETILLNTPYYSGMIGTGKKVDRQEWVNWCNAAIASAMPGAVDCLQYVNSKGVEIFYVTNRHLDTELEGTIKNFEKLGLPQADKNHMLLKTDTSYKQPRFNEVAKKYKVVLYMGDNVGDFPLETYEKLTAERNNIIDKHQNNFGTKFIVFPNPNYGAWEEALAKNYKKLSADEKESARVNALTSWNSERNKVENLLANSATAQKTDQIILVVDHTLSLWNKIEGEWYEDFETYCGYGSNGFSWNRTAGDKTTPIGAFPILHAFGLVDNPGTEMTYKKITPNSYLSAESSTYNQWVESSYRVSGEHLNEYYQYTYAMNIGFNINPTVVGKGAAIFLHCKSLGRWTTAGCVSVPENYMLDLLRKSHNGEWIIIVPKVEDIARF